jgi:hypothetical protein
MTTWAVLAPNLEPLRGRCPACRSTFDDAGCRVVRIWEVRGGPCVRAFEVACTGEPPMSESLPEWFVEAFAKK